MKFTALLFPAVVLGAACPYGTFKPEEPTDSMCEVYNVRLDEEF